MLPRMEVPQLADVPYSVEPDNNRPPSPGSPSAGVNARTTPASELSVFTLNNTPQSQMPPAAVEPYNVSPEIATPVRGPFPSLPLNRSTTQYPWANKLARARPRIRSARTDTHRPINSGRRTAHPPSDRSQTRALHRLGKCTRSNCRSCVMLRSGLVENLPSIYYRALGSGPQGQLLTRTIINESRISRAALQSGNIASRVWND